MERISSRQNAIVKRFREVAAAPGAAVLLDGAHLVDEALASRVPLQIVAMRADALGDAALARLAARAADRGAHVVAVTEPVLAAISPVRQPSGIVAIARRPSASLADTLSRAPQLVIVAADVQDPGNVGAIVRAAEACGATGVVIGAGSADPFGWKALRGSMGSAFRMPVAAPVDVEEAVAAAHEAGARVIAAVPRGGTPLPRCDLRKASAILLGGEGPGLDPAIVARADELLTIPMRPPVESLNVATAAALITYEAMRQRQGDPL